LRTDKEIAKGILIADSIEDDKLKSVIKSQIALKMSGIELKRLI